MPGSVHLGGSDEQSDPAAGGDEARGGWQDGFEALDGAESDEMELARPMPNGRFNAGGSGRGIAGLKGFGAAAEYIDIHQCKSADDFAEKGHLLLIRLDQGEIDAGRP